MFPKLVWNSLGWAGDGTGHYSRITFLGWVDGVRVGHWQAAAWPPIAASDTELLLGRAGPLVSWIVDRRPVEAARVAEAAREALLPPALLDTQVCVEGYAWNRRGGGGYNLRLTESSYTPENSNNLCLLINYVRIAAFYWQKETCKRPLAATTTSIRFDWRFAPRAIP
jgi:hypothetical protein